MTNISTGIKELADQGKDLNGSNVIEANETLKETTKDKLDELRTGVEFSNQLETVKSLIEQVRTGVASGENEEDIFQAINEAIGSGPDRLAKRAWLMAQLGLKEANTAQGFELLDIDDDQFDADEILAPISGPRTITPAASAQFATISLDGLDEVLAPGVQAFLEAQPEEVREQWKKHIEQILTETIEYLDTQDRVPSISAFRNRFASQLSPKLDSFVFQGVNIPNPLGGRKAEAVAAQIFGHEGIGEKYEAFVVEKATEAGVPTDQIEAWQKNHDGKTFEQAVAAQDRVVVKKQAKLLETITQGLFDVPTMFSEYETDVKSGLVEVTYAQWKQEKGYAGFLGVIKAVGNDLGALWDAFKHFALSFGKSDEGLGKKKAEALMQEFDTGVEQEEWRELKTYIMSKKDKFEDLNVKIEDVYVAGKTSPDTGDNLSVLVDEFNDQASFDEFLSKLESSAVTKECFKRTEQPIALSKIQQLLKPEYTVDRNGELLKNGKIEGWKDFIENPNEALVSEIMSNQVLLSNLTDDLGRGDLLAKLGESNFSAQDLHLVKSVLSNQDAYDGRYGIKFEGDKISISYKRRGRSRRNSNVQIYNSEIRQIEPTDFMAAIKKQHSKLQSLTS